MVEKKRLEYIDIAKGIGIFLVVLGHTRYPYTRDIIYSFHMPLFFFLSGYLFTLEKLEVSFTVYLKKKIKGLYRPFLTFSIFYLIFNNFFVWIKFLPDRYYYSLGESLSVLARNIVFLSDSQFSGTFWFIRNLFFLELMFFAVISVGVKYFSKSVIQYVVVVGVLSAVVCFVCSHFGIMPTFANIFGAAVFYLVGFLVRNYFYEILNFRYLKYIGFGFIVFIGYNIKVDMVVNYYSSFLGFLLTGCVGSLAVLQICMMIARFRWARLFHVLGENSIYILCFHILSFKIVLFFCLLFKGYDLSYLNVFIERGGVDTSVVYNPVTDFWFYLLGGIAFPLIIPLVKHSLKTIKYRIMNVRYHLDSYVQ